LEKKTGLAEAEKNKIEASFLFFSASANPVFFSDHDTPMKQLCERSVARLIMSHASNSWLVVNPGDCMDFGV
jgi:hypothetical protein